MNKNEQCLTKNVLLHLVEMFKGQLLGMFNLYTFIVNYAKPNTITISKYLGFVKSSI